jgi:hypothetical protein
VLALTIGCGGGDGGDGGSGSESGPMPLADLHFHARNGLSPSDAVAALDLTGVRWAGGGPRGADALWDPYLTYAPDRFIPFAGQNEITDILKAEGASAYNLDPGSSIWTYLATLESELAAGKWRGIGEIVVNNEDSGGAAAGGGLKYPANSPLIFRLLTLAHDYQVPLCLHVEADLDSLAQLDLLLANGPPGILLWAHAGTWTWPAKMEELLSKFPNLRVELSGRVELPTGPSTNVPIIDAEHQLVPEWKSLLEAYPDRFFIGTDENDDISLYPDYIDLYREVLSQLSESAAARIGCQNAQELFSLGP